MTYRNNGSETAISMRTATFRWVIGSGALVTMTIVSGTILAMNALWQIRQDISNIQNTLDYSVERTAVALTQTEENKDQLNKHDTRLQLLDDRVRWLSTRNNDPDD